MTGQNGHATRRGTAAVTAVAVVVAGTLLSAVVAAARQSDTASAATTLAEAAGARLVLADGTRRDAVAGDAVPNGATVELPGPGAAVLTTRGRETYLAQFSAVRVVDGARQRLERGTAFVDAADAPGLELATAAGRVTVRRDALVRVDGEGLPRVGVLRGTAADVRAAGRRTVTEVGAYEQVQVPVGGLVGRAAPLRLVDGDRYEQRLAGALVAADRFLNTTGDTLVRSPQQGSVLRAALVRDAPGVPADREGAIAYLVAGAASPGDVPARLGEVRALRAQGGSWGAVAGLVGASVEEVGARLDALLAPTTVALPAPDGDVDVAALLGLGGPSATPPPGGTPAPGSTPRPVPGDDPSREDDDDEQPAPPPSSPPASPGAVGTVTQTVDAVVETVLDLLAPSPSAAPVQAPVGGPAQAPAPQPLLTVDLPLLP